MVSCFLVNIVGYIGNTFILQMELWRVGRCVVGWTVRHRHTAGKEQQTCGCDKGLSSITRSQCLNFCTTEQRWKYSSCSLLHKTRHGWVSVKKLRFCGSWYMMVSNQKLLSNSNYLSGASLKDLFEQRFHAILTFCEWYFVMPIISLLSFNL